MDISSFVHVNCVVADRWGLNQYQGPLENAPADCGEVYLDDFSHDVLGSALILFQNHPGVVIEMIML